jgi:Ca-activated chloride channel homolog
MNKKRLSLSTIIFVAFLAVALGLLGIQIFSSDENIFSDGPQYDTTEIEIIYAPESESYLKSTIDNFNEEFKNGVNPITGEEVPEGEKIIQVKGISGSSGAVRTQIVSAVSGTRTDRVEKPAIFAPSVGHWLRLVNYETGKEVFKLDEAKATANAPVVIAIWESRLDWIKQKYPGQEIGWEELLSVFNSPNGWFDFSPDATRKRVYYGHTDPNISSTALSTLLSTYYANSAYEGGTPDIEQLILADVENETVKQGVRNIQNLIKHYSSRTTEFKEYIAQGPDYLDFVALEENDLIYINQGKTQFNPPEKLVALYPKEGTFVHEHPFGLVNPEAVNWITEEQHEAAKVFTEYVLSEKVQKKIMENGFRPANPAVELAYPITEELGVDPEEPRYLLNTPSAQVISTVQNDWNFVKKRSEVFMLIDTSGSMDGSPLQNAKDAMEIFAKGLPAENSVGLISFDSEIKTITPMKTLESGSSNIIAGVNELRASGSTRLYDGLLKAMEELEAQSDPSQSIIRAVVLLSDGQDTGSENTLADVVKKLEESKVSDNPILVIPIAYGQGADLQSLNAIARASSTRVQFGNTGDIEKLLEVIRSYF